MPKARHTRQHRSVEDKALLVRAVLGSKTVTEAAKEFGFQPSTAHDIWKQYQENGTVEDLPQTGQPPKLDDRGERQLVQMARRNRRTPFQQLGNQTTPPTSKDIVRQVLQRHGYVQCVSKKLLFLTDDHKKA
jgi:transposase